MPTKVQKTLTQYAYFSPIMGMLCGLLLMAHGATDSHTWQHALFCEFSGLAYFFAGLINALALLIDSLPEVN